ncbi:CHAD domain-containing protein [Methylocapsa polymorpha]|uniref:CHAD domain-containing protein n=1 Tax=Methylocapsa polymorpha TaxID=3080828 RepID=A0ABZ0HPW5_9HYPH|nr:CHAD domain-containing protein [Methylocapsa sp. RX1]
MLLPALKAALPGARRGRIDTTYFDTPDRDLWKRGFILRIRKTGQSLIQSVKQETPSAIVRGEWERETDCGAPDLAAIRRTPLAHLIHKHRLGASLRPAFEVHVERISFVLGHGGAQIEVAIDQGDIEAACGKLAVCELELELKRGDQAALFDLARTISSQGPLHLSVISKAERGHLLARGAWGCSAKSSKPRLGAHMTCRQAFQAICQSCLHDFMLNEASFGTSDRVEAIHQGRIAIRRLRAAITLFKPMVFDDAYARLHDELKWLAGLLGAARDLDVLAERMPAAGDARPAGLQAFAERIEAKQRRFHKAVLETAQEERARTLLVDIVAWIEDGQWRRRPSDLPDAALSSFIGPRLKKRLKSLLRQGGNLGDLGPEARHRVRIEAKKLRYMGEFFLDVRGVAISRKLLKRFVQSLGELQTALGEMHDEEAKVPLVEAEVQSWREEGNGFDEAAISAAEQWAAAKVDTSAELKNAKRAYLKLAKTKPF